MKKWFASLKVSQKLMLVSIVLVMPDSWVLYSHITGINANIRFARMEMKGNEYQRPLEALLELIPQHRSLALTGLAGEPQFWERLANQQAQIDAAFDALEDVDARLGSELQFTAQGLAKRKRGHQPVCTVRTEWQELKTQLAQLEPEVVAKRHLHLIADLRAMIAHVGDLSNLILDPDLDSYYLMDVTLLALPQTQDRLAEILALGEGILNRQAISGPERQQLAIYARSLKEADLDRIIGGLHTALNEDANFHGISATLQTRVAPALTEYAAATDRFIKLTSHLSDAGKIDTTAREFLAVGGKAREASFKLWTIADEELDALLQTRIEFYEWRRASSLMVRALALLAAISLVTFMTRSISGPLRQQAAELTAINGTLQAEITERNRAEKELRQSEEQLAAAQIIAGVGSWEWEVQSNKMTWSDENYRIHGFEPRAFEVSYAIALQFIHPDERATSELRIQASLKERKPFSFEQRVCRPDGTERIIHQRGEVMVGADGRAANMFGTAQDVTERKQAEADLEKAHQKLLQASRQAGMAELATGILHNVGNVLNSVNVASSCLADSLRRSKAANLSKVVALLREHEQDLGGFLTNDPKGRQVPIYLAQLAEHLSGEQAGALKELAGLQKNIEHIKDIITAQQGFAKASGATEIVNVTDLVEDALRMNASTLARHDIQVSKEFKNVLPITAKKHEVLQILVNLIRNAEQSCEASGHQEKQLSILTTNDDNSVRITINDNGVGISPENLACIFAHGFTTKKDGHGFGLHSALLAAKEMGGSLSVQSAGLGQGATFSLELPLGMKAGARPFPPEQPSLPPELSKLVMTTGL